MAQIIVTAERGPEGSEVTEVHRERMRGFSDYLAASRGSLDFRWIGFGRDEARRCGDLLFWGPGGTQHVALYLGGGKMIEASSAAGKVTVSPVRTAGLQPYVARIIES